MSQLTFDGFTPDSSSPKPKEEKPVLPKGGLEKQETWYKGRTLSNSSINLYKTCPQRWKFRYVDKVPEKPRSFFSFGKSVHTGLEFLFEKISEPLPSLDLVLAHYKEKWLREGYETGAQEKWFYQEGERILRGFYAKHKNDGKKVFQVEFKFNLYIEGVPMTGFIDRIDETPKGGLAIVDYKTGKAFDKSRVRNDPQLTLYQIAVQEVFKKPVETVSLYHLNSLTPLIVPAHSKKMEQDLRGVVVEAAQGISAEKFDPKPEERGHCQWCDYIQICPAFAGRKIALNTGPSPLEAGEKVDKLGKLDARLLELMVEREALSDELASTLRATGKDEIKGKHFTAKIEKSVDGAPDKISTSPADEGGLS